MSDANCWGWIGKPGQMVPIRGVQADLTVSTSRSTSEFLPLGGIPRRQMARSAARTWSISLSPWSDPSLVSVLRAIASGAAGDVYLYTRDHAAINLFSSQEADPSDPGNPHGMSSLLSAFPVAGERVTLGAWARSSLPSAWGESVVILPGRQYRLAAFTSGPVAAGDLFDYEVRDSGGAALVSGSLKSTSAGDGAWQTIVSAPGEACFFGVRGSAGDGNGMISGPRLTEVFGPESPALGWEVGQGVPRVDVEDPTFVLNSLAGGRVRGTFSVRLIEVI